MKITGMLPIGSVILLKDSTKKLMIIGYLQQQTEEKKVWDYVGIPYPEGYMGNTKTYLFDQVQVDCVYALGYQDNEQFAFSAHLDEMLKTLRTTSEA